MTTEPTKCPHCGKEINMAAILGARAAGRKKNFSPEELDRRRKRMLELRRQKHLVTGL